MKITRQKTNLVENLKQEKLIESDIPVIDPKDNSAEIKADVIDQVELGSEGELTISDGNAAKVATEIKAVGDEVGAGEAVVITASSSLGIKNVITDALDKAYKNAKRYQRRGQKPDCNILISGLPGSSKTASVYEWAAAHPEVNVVYINAKNNDLEAYINGYTVRDENDPNKVKQAYSDNLASLDQPNSILFLDEYNRQVKPQIRASLYTLINERKISGDGPNKTREFKNLLFTIACINPAVPTDKGAAPLNDAEQSRFTYTLKNVDSMSDITLEYITKLYKQRISKLDPKDEFYLEDLEDYLHCLDLGSHILSHYLFEYDTEEDLEELADSQKKMFNQRVLTSALENCQGRVDDFIIWLNKESDLLEKNISNLTSILDDYTEPSFEELCKIYGIKLEDKEISKDSNLFNEFEDDDSEVELGTAKIEDDEDFFGNTELSGASVRVKNGKEVETAILDTISKW